MGDFEDDFDHEEDDFAYCPMCGGAGFELGALGNRRHYRCRDCGIDFSDDAKTSATITSWNSVMKMSSRREVALYLPDRPFVVDGVAYYVDGNITFDFDWGDHGIGPYEAWGQRGVDSRMGSEDVTAVDVESILQETPGQDDADRLLTPEEEEAIKPALLKAINDTLDEDGKFADEVSAAIDGDMNDPYADSPY